MAPDRRFALAVLCCVLVILAYVAWLCRGQRPLAGELVVWEEQPVGREWVVPWMYGDEITLSYHGDKDDAARLYAVLAGKMRE